LAAVSNQSDNSAAITAAQQAVTDAQAELAVRVTTAQKDPSQANVAAVNALQDRVATAESALSALLTAGTPSAAQTAAEAAAQTEDFSQANTTATQLAAAGESTTTAPPLGTGAPVPVIGPPIPAPAPGGGVTTVTTGGADLTAAQIAALVAAEVSGDDGATAAWIDESGQETSATDSWDYLRDAVENVFTDLEGSFDSLTSAAADVSVAVEVAELGAGVTADIVDLPAVLVILGLLIGEYLTGKLLDLVGEYFPNPSIFGWHPLAFISEGITALGNQFANSASDLLGDIANVFIQPVRMLVGLFQRVFNGHAANHNATAHVINTVIPAATSGLLADANTYTDNHLETTLTEAETYANTLHNELVNDIAVAKAEAENQAQSDVTAVQNDLISRLQGDEATLQALSTEVTTTLPAEIETQINESVATENQRLTAAITPLQQQIATLQTQMANEQAAIANANATITSATAAIQSLSSQEVVDEGAIAQQQTIIASAQTDIATSTTAISTLESQITSISSTLSPIQATQQLQTSTLNQIVPIVETSLPVAIAAISATVNSLKTDVDECMVDNCDTANPNNIQNVLRDLLALLTAAAEIGFIAEAVKDPLGTADALAPFLNGIDTSAVDTLNLLLEL
jgi:hypothetical protein